MRLFLVKTQGQLVLTHPAGAFLLSLGVSQPCSLCCKAGSGSPRVGVILFWLGTERLLLFILDFCIWP